MALTSKGTKWESKNSLYVILAFIPILNGLAFFHMNSRVKNKKWSLLGWFAIVFQIIILVFGMVILPGIQYTTGPEPLYYSDVATYPEVEDFMTKEQKAKFYEDSSYSDSTEFKLTAEYENYQKAIDQYYDDQEQWEQQPEVVAQEEKYDNYQGVINGLRYACVAAFAIVYLFLLIIVFNERPKYLRLLSQSENKTDFAERMNNVRQNMTQSSGRNQSQNIVQNNVQNSAQSTSAVKIDINSASEEELASLTGITIIDAKKAVAYREEHGGFSTVDEFFTCINAKPHIIVSLEPQLTVGDFKLEKSDTTGNTGKRQLDL